MAEKNQQQVSERERRRFEFMKAALTGAALNLPTRPLDYVTAAATIADLALEELDRRK